MKKILLVMVSCVMTGVLLCACGESDENQTIEQTRAEASTMYMSELDKKIEALDKQIKEKKNELLQNAEKLKEAAKDPMSDETIKLNNEASKMTDEIKKLENQMKVYLDEKSTTLQKELKK